MKKSDSEKYGIPTLERAIKVQGPCGLIYYDANGLVRRPMTSAHKRRVARFGSKNRIHRGFSVLLSSFLIDGRHTLWQHHDRPRVPCSEEYCLLLNAQVVTASFGKNYLQVMQTFQTAPNTRRSTPFDSCDRKGGCIGGHQVCYGSFYCCLPARPLGL